MKLSSFTRKSGLKPLYHSPDRITAIGENITSMWKALLVVAVVAFLIGMAVVLRFIYIFIQIASGVRRPTINLHPRALFTLISTANPPLKDSVWILVGMVIGLSLLGYFLYRGMGMCWINFRYGTLMSARLIGPAWRWITSDWRLMVLTLALAFVVDAFVPADTDLPTRCKWVLGIYTLLFLAWIAVQAHSLTLIEEFTDYSGLGRVSNAEGTSTVHPDAKAEKAETPGETNAAAGTSPEPVANKPMPTAAGIASLLADHLSRMRDLYRNLDQQTAVYARGVDIPVSDANIRTDKITDMFKDAVPADAKFRIGFFEIPVGLLMRLLGRVSQGPRIVGSLYREGTYLVLTAKMVGGPHNYSWRVDSPLPLAAIDGDGSAASIGLRTLDDMVAELACRIFTDVALESCVRWRATYEFNQGLRAYRNCLRTHRDRKSNLHQAEKAFLKAISIDEGFEWVYYNLGLVYSGMGQQEAALIAFFKALEKDRNRWEIHYALAQTYFQNAEECAKLDQRERGISCKTASQTREEHNYMWVVALCERVIALMPDQAKGYRLRCRAYYKEACRITIQQMEPFSEDSQNIDKYLEQARRHGETAVYKGWRELSIAYWQEGASDPGNKTILQLTTVTHGSLYELAGVYVMLADRQYKVRDDLAGKAVLSRYEHAIRLLWQAAYLKRSDADTYLLLGRIYFRLRRYSYATQLCRYAVRIDSTRADIWAYISLLSNLLTSTKSSEEKAPPPDKEQLGLLEDDHMSAMAWREFCRRTCDAGELDVLQSDFGWDRPDGSSYRPPWFPNGIDANFQSEKRTLIRRVKERNALYTQTRMYRRQGSLGLEKLEQDLCKEGEILQPSKYEMVENGLMVISTQVALYDPHETQPSAEMVKMVRTLLELVLFCFDAAAPDPANRDDWNWDAWHDMLWNYGQRVLILSRLTRLYVPERQSEQRERLKRGIALLALERFRLTRLGVLQNPNASVTEKDIYVWKYSQLSLLLGNLCLEASQTGISPDLNLVHIGSLPSQKADSQNQPDTEQSQNPRDEQFTKLNECFEATINLLQKHQLEPQIQKQGLHAVWANALLDFMPQAPEQPVPPTAAKSKPYALKALQQAHLAIDQDPLNAYEHFTLGRVYTRLNELDQASSEYEDAWLCRPEEPEYLLEGGNVKLKLARDCYDNNRRKQILLEARGFLIRAIELYGSGQERQIAHAHFTLGQIQIELNAYPQAIQHFRIAIALDYAPTTSRFGLAWSLLHSKHYDECVYHFGVVINEHKEQLQTEPALLNYTKIVYEYESDRPRSLGLILTYSYLGIANSYIERNANGAEKRPDPEHPDPEPPETNPKSLLKKAKICIDGMTPTDGSTSVSDDKRLCQQGLADAEGWYLYKQWMQERWIQDTQSEDHLEDAIQKFQKAIWYRADPQSYYHLALCYEAKLQMIWEIARVAVRRHLLQLARAQCKQALELDYRSEYRQLIEELEVRLQALEATPVASKI